MPAHRRLTAQFGAGLQFVRDVLKHFEIRRDALGLDRSPRGCEVSCRRQRQRAVPRAERNDGLHGAFAERARPDQGGALVVVQGARHDLGSGSRSAVDQHDERLALDHVAAACGEALGFLRRTAAGRDHLAARHEGARHRDRLVEQSARVVAEVNDIACEFFRRDFL